MPGKASGVEEAFTEVDDEESDDVEVVMTFVEDVMDVVDEVDVAVTSVDVTCACPSSDVDVGTRLSAGICCDVDGAV